MRAVTLDRVRVAHALGMETGPNGTVFHRFPAWARARTTAPSFPLVESMPTGVRLEMRTTATRLELDVVLTIIENDGVEIAPAVFDLVADGEVVDTRRTSVGHHVLVDSRTGAVDIVPGEPTTIVFDDVPPASEIAVWLPPAAGLELLELRVPAGAEVEPPPLTLQRRWVHHGSSISHCMEADQATGTWPAVAARLAGVDLHNLAVAGECHLDGFTARIIRDEPADLISLELGINLVNEDSMRERTFVSAVHSFLDLIRDGHTATPIVVVTPIFCPSAEDHPGPTVSDGAGTFIAPERPQHLNAGALTLRRIRELLADVVAARREWGDDHLHLLDGLQLFGPDEVDDLPDALHPNPAGYRRMGERFHRLVFTGSGPFAA